MRVVLALLVALAAVASFALGFVMALEGFAEYNVVANTYTVNFARPGEDCGAERLELDIEDGSRLGCSAGLPVYEDRWKGLPGFTDAQNDEVLSLAAQLGADGLSPADQELIQERVDDLAATVAPAQRPRGDTIITGWPPLTQAWTGVAMVALPVLGYLFISWRYR